MALEDLFGSPDYLRQLVGEEQFNKAQNQAFNQGLINAGLAMLSGSAQTDKLGQLIGAAGQAGMQGYQGAMDKTLTDIAKGMQVQEMLRKQKEAQQIKDVMASAATPTYAYGAGEQGPTKELTGMTYDMKSVIPTLQALGRFDLIKDIGESQKTLRQSGIMGDTSGLSPFAPYLNAESPQVKALAQQYEAGFKKGIIDEETAYKRLEPLAKMEEQYQSRLDKKAEGKKTTADEKKSAGFAQRMELAEIEMADAEGKVAEAQLKNPNVKYGKPYESSATRFAGGIPFISEWARGQVSTEQQKSYRQAQENWVRANLRKESGAVIGPSEMQDEIVNYFPMPTDPPSLIEQKRINRAVTVANMKREAGAAYEPFDINKFVKDNGLEKRK